MALEGLRKRRQEEINFHHNPIDAENITRRTKWEILKERNNNLNRNSILKQKNIFLKGRKKRATYKSI